MLIYEQSKNEALLYENLEPQREASAKTSPDNPPKVHWEHRFVSLLQNSPLKPNPSAHSSHEVQQAAAVVAEIESLSLLQPLICPLYPFLVDRFESVSSIYLLVRPDLHVACVADITDLEPLKIFFGRWLNPLMLSLGLYPLMSRVKFPYVQG